ncbi:MAG: biotin--[acetyl-CoA-carboxylase] ligase [Chlorobium sp.]|nr:biotin--[acetyl-CoA-carboxylase] ligase [Chlorobium sp.]MCW8819283.1 biotin--[acetyl-CoA-carboxylase] ligase [Ignavibacteriaceae bacterium]
MNQQTADILQRLRASESFLSGGELCRDFGMTRSAVWKHISRLREAGYSIEAVSGRGYRLHSSPDIPVSEEVSPRLTTTRFGRNFLFHEEVDSTNMQAKILARQGASEGSVLVADCQTGGRGRMGREWVSPPGSNLYFSLVLRPPVPPTRLSQIPLLAAAAIHRALVGSVDGVSSAIKWPNDILIDGRKVCGILCEMETEPDMTHFVIVGIGVNVNLREIPGEIEGIATSLFLESGTEYSRPDILSSILNSFETIYDTWLEGDDLEAVLPYLERYAWLKDREVKVEQYKSTLEGRVRGLSRTGELLLESQDGSMHAISSGEARLRKGVQY